MELKCRFTNMSISINITNIYIYIEILQICVFKTSSRFVLPRYSSKAARTMTGSEAKATKCWTKRCKTSCNPTPLATPLGFETIWGFPKMVVPKNHGFSYKKWSLWGVLGIPPYKETPILGIPLYNNFLFVKVAVDWCRGIRNTHCFSLNRNLSNT